MSAPPIEKKGADHTKNLINFLFIKDHYHLKTNITMQVLNLILFLNSWYISLSNNSQIGTKLRKNQNQVLFHYYWVLINAQEKGLNHALLVATLIHQSCQQL